jgi:hypothetical protein
MKNAEGGEGERGSKKSQAGRRTARSEDPWAEPTNKARTMGFLSLLFSKLAVGPAKAKPLG